jgi:hypothetical protein
MTSKDHGSLITEIATLLPDNTAQEITAGDVRTILTDIVDTNFRSDALALETTPGLLVLEQGGYLLLES